MKNSFKKAAALLTACALCLSTGYLSAYAARVADGYNGKVGEFVYVQKDAKDFINTDNFFGSRSYNQQAAQIYMPGDTITGSVEIKNENPQTVDLYLIAGATSKDKYQSYITANGITGKSADQVKSLSEKLVKQINLKVEYTNASGAKTVIYDGKMGGASSNGKSMLSTIKLGSYGQNASGKLDFTLDIPKTLSNDYNGAVAMIDWIFTAQGEDPPPPSPGTGEESIPYAVAAAACAVSAIAMFVVVFRKSKNEDEIIEA